MIKTAQVKIATTMRRTAALLVTSVSSLSYPHIPRLVSQVPYDINSGTADLVSNPVVSISASKRFFVAVRAGRCGFDRGREVVFGVGVGRGC